MVSGAVFHPTTAELAETAVTATTNNRRDWRTSAGRQEAILERGVRNGIIIVVLSSAKTIFVTVIPAMLPVTYGDYGPRNHDCPRARLTPRRKRGFSLDEARVA